MISLAYEGRSIPLLWTWVKKVKGHSSAVKQKALLAYLHTMIPQGVPVVVVGDSEFGAVAVLKLLDSWGWKYALRQKGSNCVYLPQEGWKGCGEHSQ